jgi:hypothetical protein
MRWIWGSLLLLAVGCDSSHIDIDAQRYACETTEDCRSGWVCSVRVCVETVAAAGDGGDPSDGGPECAGTLVPCGQSATEGCVRSCPTIARPPLVAARASTATR